MALMAAGIGAVGSIAGGLLGKKKSSGSGFTPTDSYGPAGSVSMTKDKKGRHIKTHLGGEQAQQSNMWGDIFARYMQPNAVADWAQQAGGGALPGLFGEYMGMQGPGPQTLQQYLSQMSGAAGQLGQYGGALGQAGLSLLGGPAPGSAEAAEMMGLGRGFMTPQGKTYEDIYNQRLAGLRADAAPQEEMALNSLVNRGFMKGRGGAEDTEMSRALQGFAKGQSQADTTRMLDAMGLSESLYGRDQAADLSRAGIGSGLFSGGLQGLLSGENLKYGAGSELLGGAGNMAGMQGDMFGNIFNSQMQFDEFNRSRGQERMRTAADMFGFGRGIEGEDMSRASGAAAQQQALIAQLLQQAGLTGQISGASQGTPGTSTGQVIGAGMQGFFGSDAFSNMFGGSGGGSPTNADIEKLLGLS